MAFLYGGKVFLLFHNSFPHSLPAKPEFLLQKNTEVFRLARNLMGIQPLFAVAKAWLEGLKMANKAYLTSFHAISCNPHTDVEIYSR